MKSIFYFLAIIILLLAFAFTGNNAPIKAVPSIDTLHISISLRSKKDTLKADDIVIDVELQDLSATTIRLPDLFKYPMGNTYISVSTESNRTISPIKVALTDYSSQPVSSYISIAPHKSYKTRINIGDMLINKKLLLTGNSYKLELSYINQKGSNCIKGTYYSNPVYFTIIHPAQPVPLLPPVPEKNSPVKLIPQTSVVNNVATFTVTKDTLHIKPFKPLVGSKNKTGKFKDDRDGQVYSWVKIGKQIWMSENLNYKSRSGYSYHYDNDSTNTHKYGMYYDFAALNDACPKGWHVPTDLEWQQLEIEGGIPVDQVNKYGWNGDDISAFLPGGSTGLNVLFAGQRRSAKVYEDGERAYFWTARNVQVSQYYDRREFIRSYNRIMRVTQGTSFALSVRCVKDQDN